MYPVLGLPHYFWLEYTDDEEETELPWLLTIQPAGLCLQESSSWPRAEFLGAPAGTPILGREMETLLSLGTATIH